MLSSLHHIIFAFKVNILIEDLIKVFLALERVFWRSNCELIASEFISLWIKFFGCVLNENRPNIMFGESPPAFLFFYNCDRLLLA